MVIVPKKFFLTSGVGRSEDQLFSFELALRDAGVEGANIVPVTSICPPDCVELKCAKGINELGICGKHQGRIVFAVKSQVDIFGAAKRSVVVSSSVAYARPTDKNSFGYFTEYHGRKNAFTMQEKSVHYAKKMIESRGLSVDEDNFGAITASAKTASGEWLVVVALAVLID